MLRIIAYFKVESLKIVYKNYMYFYVLISSMSFQLYNNEDKSWVMNKFKFKGFMFDELFY